MTPNLHLWLIPVLPLVGGAINGLLGRRFTRQIVSAVALLFCGAAFVLALWVAFQFPSLSGPYKETLASWIRAGDLRADFAFYLDQLSLVMLLVVTGVGFLIHIYSVGYMWEEGGLYRFFSYLNLFMFFMLTLVLADNYLLMFIGWEGVGLASYLLIGFWFTKDSAASAGKKAFIVNRIGDFGFLIALFLLIKHFGTLNFDQLFLSITPMSPELQGAGLLTSIALLLMLGACGKSAQIPLYVWLPDAMEGPTPVSALIHAATMVTAGVYMVARSHVIFDRAPAALMVVAIIGTLTALFAATIGICQTDIKKVLAYSTISQLGYMFLACGVAAYSAGIFHLMTHAFFKGLLFLAAGSVIHAIGGEQDMRKMGGLRTKIPCTFWTMTAATLAIAGIPPFAGFFSKDEILWRAYSSPYGNWVYWLIGVITAFITSFYMFRLWFLTFFGEYRGAGEETPGSGHVRSYSLGEILAEVQVPEEFSGLVMGDLNERDGKIVDLRTEDGKAVILAEVPVAHMSGYENWLSHATRGHGEYSARPLEKAASATHPANAVPHGHGGIHESPKVMLVPLVILAVLSVIGGWVGYHNTFENFLSPVFRAGVTASTPVEALQAMASTEPRAESGASESLLMGISIVAAVGGLFLAWLLYYRRPEVPGKIAHALGGFYDAVLNKYYVDELYAVLFVRPLVNGSAKLLWRGIDQNVIDATVDNSAEGAREVSDTVRHMQSGNLRSYAGWVAAGAAAVIVYMVWIGIR
jgi:NADH-quinone oxidoreductase subunit L